MTQTPTYEEMQETLAHFGVKGMKWGVRKETAKKIGKEVAIGSITPAAMLAGLGPPLSVALGLTIFAAQQTYNAVKTSRGAEFVADTVDKAGDTTVSAMKSANKTAQKTVSKM